MIVEKRIWISSSQPLRGELRRPKDITWKIICSSLSRSRIPGNGSEKQASY